MRLNNPARSVSARFPLGKGLGRASFWQYFLGSVPDVQEGPIWEQ
ncbi:hypothetical protein [Candidatus Methylacidithermus pantelleriae]|nr:hypothetical protein [Candidatus Methylacidithermus pantelleriae]